MRCSLRSSLAEVDIVHLFGTLQGRSQVRTRLLCMQLHAAVSCQCFRCVIGCDLTISNADNEQLLT